MVWPWGLDLAIQAKALVGQTLKMHDELKQTPITELKFEVVYLSDGEIRRLGTGAVEKEDL